MVCIWIVLFRSICLNTCLLSAGVIGRVAEPYEVGPGWQRWATGGCFFLLLLLFLFFEDVSPASLLSWSLLHGMRNSAACFHHHDFYLALNVMMALPFKTTIQKSPPKTKNRKLQFKNKPLTRPIWEREFFQGYFEQWSENFLKKKRKGWGYNSIENACLTWRSSWVQSQNQNR